MVFINILAQISPFAYSNSFRYCIFYPDTFFTINYPSVSKLFAFTKVIVGLPSETYSVFSLWVIPHPSFTPVNIGIVSIVLKLESRI